MRAFVRLVVKLTRIERNIGRVLVVVLERVVVGIDVVRPARQTRLVSAMRSPARRRTSVMLPVALIDAEHGVEFLA